MRCVRLLDGARIRYVLPQAHPAPGRVDVRCRREGRGAGGPAVLTARVGDGESLRVELGSDPGTRWQWTALKVERAVEVLTLGFNGHGALLLDGFFIHDGSAPVTDDVRELDETVGLVEARATDSERRVDLAVPGVSIGPVPRPHRFLSDVARECADASVIDSLAAKPCPYIVKPFDTPGGTDYNSDYTWHAFDKEKLWDLPASGFLGVFNPNSEIWLGVGIGVGERCVYEGPDARCTLHTIDTLIYEVAAAPDLRCEVAFRACRSDILVVDVRLMNRSDREARVLVGVLQARFAGAEPPAQRFTLPNQKFGSGVTTTTGKREWSGNVAGLSGRVAGYREWVRGRCRDRRIVACLAAAQSGPCFDFDPDRLRSGAAEALEVGAGLVVPAGGFAGFRAALTLRRFTTDDTWNPEVTPRLYPCRTEYEAAECAVRACGQALAEDPEDNVRLSLKPYDRFPRVNLPIRSWETAFHACLELPRASTFSPYGALRTPFYNFCRAHAHDPFGWWSYGMHAHESLCTLFANIVDPGLSAQFLRGHIGLQREDGKYPYGVSHSTNPRTSTDEATLPLIVWEAWQAYLWSGDREFLREAYRSGVNSHAWWLLTRDRCGEGLCHWLNTSWESARDDNSLVTWQLTGGSQYQEALDLNCYLLVEERTLSEMALELGMDEEAGQWRSAAYRRAKLMNAWMWSDEDQCYYGIGEVVRCLASARDISTFFPLWSKLAPEGRFEPIAGLVEDPRTFGLPFGPPVLAADEPGFGPDAHWQGANWVQMSMFVISGLRNYGYYRSAARLALSNTRMVFEVLEREGHFREYFDSVTGEGVDLIDYIWTAMPAHFIVSVFFGIEPGREGVAIAPALPDGWNRIDIENLHLRGRRVAVSVRVDPGAVGTRATVDGAPAPIVEGRGVFVPWAALSDGIRVEIVQPSEIEDAPRAPAETPTEWADVPDHDYPEDPALAAEVRSLMKLKADLW